MGTGPFFIRFQLSCSQIEATQPAGAASGRVVQPAGSTKNSCQWSTEAPQHLTRASIAVQRRKNLWGSSVPRYCPRRCGTGRRYSMSSPIGQCDTAHPTQPPLWLMLNHAPSTNGFPLALVVKASCSGGRSNHRESISLASPSPQRCASSSAVASIICRRTGESHARQRSFCSAVTVHSSRNRTSMA